MHVSSERLKTWHVPVDVAAAASRSMMVCMIAPKGRPAARQCLLFLRLQDVLFCLFEADIRVLAVQVRWRKSLRNSVSGSAEVRRMRWEGAHT